MTKPPLHDFGLLPEHDDSFEFTIDLAAGGACQLREVVQTECGPRRTELAEVPSATWRKISVRAVHELAAGMGETARAKAAPRLKTGVNRLSPLIGRELAALLWALREDPAGEQLESILHGWRELAREERWWLYAKAAAPGQRIGIGWRRALFHALSEAGDSRAECTAAEKKSPAKADLSRSALPTRAKRLLGLQPRRADANNAVRPNRSTLAKESSLTTEENPI